MTEELRVLVLDRDLSVVNRRESQLQLDGFMTERARTIERARSVLSQARLLVLGELDGGPVSALNLLRELRGGRLEGVLAHLPVIAFADSDAQLLSTVRAGADMTLPSSASDPLISASVEALAHRRWNRMTNGMVKLGSLELDREGRSASVNGNEVTLTRRQFQLLSALATTPGRVYTREELSHEVWGTPHINGSRAMDTHLSRLGQRLSEAGAQRMIQTVRGEGFKLTAGAER
jgi:DNA-binding response OmpR family regulator